MSMSEQEKLVAFGCLLEETMRWLYATAAQQVAASDASEVLRHLAAAEAEHLASLEAAFGVRLEDKSWSRPLGAYVRAHVLKTSAPPIWSDDVSGILRTAYAFEAGGGCFYQRWQEGNDDPRLDQILRDFVAAERAHRQWVWQCHEHLVDWPEL